MLRPAGVHVYMRMCVYVYNAYNTMHGCTFVRVYAYMCMCVYVCMCIYVCIQYDAYMCICVYVCICMYACFTAPFLAEALGPN